MFGIKIFDNKEYAEQFVTGRVYFSAAGRFQNIQDSQRKYLEGQVPINSHPLTINGQVFNEVTYSIGYEEHDRVPIFCFVCISEANINIVEGHNEFNYSSGIKEMGSFGVVFEIDKFHKALKEKVCNCGIGIIGKKVNYFDFTKKDDEWLNYLRQNSIDKKYDRFFIHDKKHEEQNEFRFVLTHKLMTKDLSGTIIDIGQDTEFTRNAKFIDFSLKKEQTND